MGQAAEGLEQGLRELEALLGTTTPLPRASKKTSEEEKEGLATALEILEVYSEKGKELSDQMKEESLKRQQVEQFLEKVAEIKSEEALYT